MNPRLIKIWKFFFQALSVALVVFLAALLYFRYSDVTEFYAIRGDEVAACLVQAEHDRQNRDDCGLVGNDGARKSDRVNLKRETVQSIIFTPFGLLFLLPIIYILRRLWRD